MAEVLNYFFHPLPNAIMTFLVGLSALYWIVTFISGDFLGDLDVGLDVDADMDGDLNTEAPDPSFFSKMLAFINVGKVPVMVVISTFKFIGWLLTLASSMVWNVGSWGMKSVLVLIPIFIVAYFLTRFATKPFVSIYKSMGYNGEDKHELIGRVARMKSSIEGDKIGNAELVIMNDVIRVMVKSKGGTPIAFDSEVTLLSESGDRKFYFVVPEINLNNVV